MWMERGKIVHTRVMMTEIMAVSKHNMKLLTKA